MYLFRCVCLLPLLVACGHDEVTEEDFPERAAEQACIYTDQCHNALALLGTPDIASCIEKLTPDYEGGEGCVFDQVEAQACIDSFEELNQTCRDRVLDNRACRNAWDCSGAG